MFCSLRGIYNADEMGISWNRTGSGVWSGIFSECNHGNGKNPHNQLNWDTTPVAMVTAAAGTSPPSWGLGIEPPKSEGLSLGRISIINN